MACSLVELIGLACMALVLFTVSHWIQYYVKMVSFIVASLVFAVVPIPLMLPRPRDHRNAL
jgi:lysophosphatidate acyltransferase